MRLLQLLIISRRFPDVRTRKVYIYIYIYSERSAGDIYKDIFFRTTTNASTRSTIICYRDVRMSWRDEEVGEKKTTPKPGEGMGGSSNPSGFTCGGVSDRASVVFIINAGRRRKIMMRFNGTRGALALLDGDQTATLRDPGQTECRAKRRRSAWLRTPPPRRTARPDADSPLLPRGVYFRAIKILCRACYVYRRYTPLAGPPAYVHAFLCGSGHGLPAPGATSCAECVRRARIKHNTTLRLHTLMSYEKSGGRENRRRGIDDSGDTPP